MQKSLVQVSFCLLANFAHGIQVKTSQHEAHGVVESVIRYYNEMLDASSITRDLDPYNEYVFKQKQFK